MVLSLLSRTVRPPANEAMLARAITLGAEVTNTQTLVAEAMPRRGVRATLRRDLGFWGTASLSVGGMAPTLAMSVTGVQSARLLGRAAPLAYVLAGAGMVLISYGFVRLSAAYSHA